MLFKRKPKIKTEDLPFKKDLKIDKRIPKIKKVPDSEFKEKSKLPVIDDPVGKVRNKKKLEKLSWWQRRKLKRKPATSFLIKMFFSNGTAKEFIITTRGETFDYMKRTYYLRYEDSWFNLTQNQYELNYFDDHPVPLDRKIERKGDKAFWVVTPDNLKPLIEMEYVKALAKSQELDRYLKMNATLTIFLLFLSLWMVYFLFKISKAISGG